MLTLLALLACAEKPAVDSVSDLIWREAVLEQLNPPYESRIPYCLEIPYPEERWGVWEWWEGQETVDRQYVEVNLTDGYEVIDNCLCEVSGSCDPVQWGYLEDHDIVVGYYDDA